MIQLIKVVHLFALAAWSGAVIFFAFFIALPTIEAMKKLATTTGNWLQLNTEQQGTRLAGEFLDLAFTRYFPFQAVCAVLAMATSLWWWNTPGWAGKLRVIILVIGLGCVVTNLTVLGPKVHELRTDRYSSDAAVAERANAAFGPAHTWSLLTDMVGLLCALAALVLVIWWPEK
ncbi:MAG TPA: DUF4149 domain-containing protein [Gemmatales bacterium]|nr:DUF4149 domain-containing protein [Gemmatales bacterium]